MCVCATIHGFGTTEKQASKQAMLCVCVCVWLLSKAWCLRQGTNTACVCVVMGDGAWQSKAQCVCSVCVCMESGVEGCVCVCEKRREEKD